jgi:F-type H+-transporting ATPase subunit a
MIDLGKVGEHVQDTPFFEVPEALWKCLPEAWRQPPAHLHLTGHPGQVWLPNFGTVELFGRQIELQVTKFMVLELVVAVAMAVIFIGLARRIADGRPPRGRLWNMIEVMVVFVRNEMVRPAIGGRTADRFLPLLWTLFFFILSCNLLGLLPWAGSPTGSLAVTGALAAIVLVTVLGAGMKKYGTVGFWIGLVPHMDVPRFLKIPLWLMIFAIEAVGLLIRHFILAVRLLANMFAGHLVVAVIIGFIAATAASWLWWGVMPISVLGSVALDLLEILVALIQAYIFTFLAALFIGMAVHQH